MFLALHEAILSPTRRPVSDATTPPQPLTGIRGQRASELRGRDDRRAGGLPPSVARHAATLPRCHAATLPREGDRRQIHRPAKRDHRRAAAAKRRQVASLLLRHPPTTSTTSRPRSAVLRYELCHARERKPTARRRHHVISERLPIFAISKAYRDVHCFGVALPASCSRIWRLEQGHRDFDSAYLTSSIVLL